MERPKLIDQKAQNPRFADLKKTAGEVLARKITVFGLGLFVLAANQSDALAQALPVSQQSSPEASAQAPIFPIATPTSILDRYPNAAKDDPYKRKLLEDYTAAERKRFEPTVTPTPTAIPTPKPEMVEIMPRGTFIERRFKPADVVEAIAKRDDLTRCLVFKEVGGGTKKYARYEPYSIGDQDEEGPAQLHPQGMLQKFYKSGYKDPYNPEEAVKFMVEQIEAGYGNHWSGWRDCVQNPTGYDLSL